MPEATTPTTPATTTPATTTTAAPTAGAAGEMKTVLVLGAGQMGEGIAQVAAVSKFAVIVYDLSNDALRRCQENHKKRLAKLAEKPPEKGGITPSEAEAAAARIKYAHNLAPAAGADIAIEAVVENFDVKKKIFHELAAMFKGRQILATNTSSISITSIAASVPAAADRVVGMHFFNPVPVMKLVEVIKGVQTSAETVERTLALSKAMGKTPIPANDRAGFVSNRVLMPMINEAFYAWMEGVAEPAHIDEIMKLGCNFPMGPLRLADFIGLDTCVNIMEVLAEGLNNPRYRACPLLKQLVVAGRLGDKSGRGVFEYPAKA
jgi:3-hydroxybutyryl-CoA dehydrogenase